MESEKKNKEKNKEKRGEKSEEENEEKLDHIFFALADHKRRQILDLLSDGPVTVTDLASHFKMTLGAVSKNITVLEKADLIVKIKKGRNVHCQLNHDVWQEILIYISGAAHFWKNRLNDLAQYVEDTTSIKRN